jgi:hypothetical protein
MVYTPIEWFMMTHMAGQFALVIDKLRAVYKSADSTRAHIL